MVHFYRNVLRVVPTGKVREVVALLKAIHGQGGKGGARAKGGQVVSKLEGLGLGRAGELVRAAVAESLAYMSFPREHWVRIRTNNPLERLNREIKRRTRVVGAFPDGESALVLVAARLRHMAGTKWGTRRYLNMDKLRAVEVEKESASGVA